jgi:glycosyltransferase involved in cell wall biosynthesis
VRMWTATTGNGELFVQGLRERGVEVVSIPAGRHVNPSIARALWVEMRRFKPDLLHTHLIHGDLYGQPVARAGGIPAVSSFHGSHEFFLREPVRSAERAAGRLARRTIAISKHVRDFLVRSRLRRTDTIEVIPYGIDPSEWRLADAQRTRARARLGLGNGEIAVGIASRLVPGKGHDLLLAAFTIALADARNIRLLIAGDGPLQPEIEHSARALGASVSMMGFIPDIQRFIASCDIFVFPTLPTFGEGFGLAALEAMTAGKPVIATRVASLPEIVVDGQTGILVPHDDPRPLAAALVRTTKDATLRTRMGEAGRRRATECFDLGRMVTSTLSVYRDSVA